jgi:Holliday junction resolvase
VTAYRKGVRLEHAIIAQLRAYGWVTIRSAGSKGAVDVVGIAPGRLVLIQAKADGRLDAKDWDELYDLARCCGGEPVLMTAPTVGLELLDRKYARRSLAAQSTRPFHPSLTYGAR